MVSGGATHLTPALSPLKGGEGESGKSLSALLQGGEGFRVRWVVAAGAYASSDQHTFSR
jgi:hypothetical protein